MRKLLILAVLCFGLIACEKDKTDTPATAADASTAVDGSTQDGVQTAEDVTASVDVTATTGPAADVTVTD